MNHFVNTGSQNDRVGSAAQIVAMDVGNTRVKFGLFRLTPCELPVALDLSACVLESTHSVIHAFRSWMTDKGGLVLDRFSVAGSDPEMRDQLLQNWPADYAAPQIISRYDQIPVGMDVEFPERVGIDRLLTTFAAFQMAGRQRAVIVVDSGTATTVDLMTEDGIFRGGSILPGLRLSAHAMHDYTARLPMLDTDRELNELPELPGRNTEDAMLAGLYIGQLGAVRELVSGLTAAAMGRFRQHQPPLLFVSGGGGRQLVQHLDEATFADSLALHGLAMLPSHLVSR